jgi:hypothetical protein
LIAADPDLQKTGREKTIRTRNRALVAVLVTLVALFYALAIVRMGG